MDILTASVSPTDHCLILTRNYFVCLYNRVALEGGIYLSHIIWRIRYRKLRKEAKASGKSVDDILESRETGGIEYEGSEANSNGGDEEKGVVTVPETKAEPEPETGIKS